MACYPGQPAAGKGVSGFETDPLPLRSHSTQAIIRWLEDTYHYEDGICLPRSTIYEHYTDFCMRGQLQPVNAASFGKIIRQQFPTLTTRRLGTRGQSKYHYYGLGIKPTSVYYTEDYLQKQQNQGITKKEPETKKTHAYYASKEKPSAVLPKFPDVRHLTPCDAVSKEKLHTFMVMYRAHCQRILDSVVRANFDEVENFLLHFWQGMPPHLVHVMSSDLVVDLVAVCDFTLYKAIISIYITTPLQNIPDNVAQEVRRFTNSLQYWLEPALRGLPECLIAVKLKAADMFSKSFKRQRSLMHLADATRNAFKGDESLEQLENDWAGLNLQTVLAQTLYTIQPLNIPQHYLDMVPNFLAEFSFMFSDEKCSLEDFAVWIESVMDNCLKPQNIRKGSIKTAGKAFLLTWKFFTSKIVREFTLMSAPSFGTFHLLHMLVDDYIMHTLETMLEKEQEELHLKRINLFKQEDVVEDIQVEDRLLSLNSDVAGNSLSLAGHGYSQLGNQRSAEFTHKHTSPPNTAGTIMGGLGGRGGGVVPISRVGVMDNKGVFPSSLLPNTEESNNLMNTMQMEPSLPRLGHTSGIVPESAASAETFGNLMSSQDDSSLHQEQVLGLRYSSESGSMAAARSLSHPNLRSISPRPLPRVTQPLAPVPTHSQAQLSFPTNFGGFALSSMMPMAGHFASPHSQLQTQSLSAAGNLIQGLGVSVGLSHTQPQPISAQSLSLSAINPMPSGFRGGTNNPPITSVSLNGSVSRSNLPPNTSLPMPLTHPIASNLSNPAGLPTLIQGMPNVYPYPYTTPLPTQPVSSSLVRVNAPGFPTQSIVPGYHTQYLPPSLYENSQQPPVSSGNFSR